MNHKVFSLIEEKIQSKKVLEFAALESNFNKLVKYVMQLSKKDRLNIEQAAKVADQMQAFARQKLKELEEK